MRQTSGSTVTVTGRSASGQGGPLTGSITVTEDLTALPVGAKLGLYFDLLGFGPEGTSALIQRPGAWPAFEGGKIELLEVPSGEPITTIADKSANLIGHSADGRVLQKFLVIHSCRSLLCDVGV